MASPGSGAPGPQKSIEDLKALLDQAEAQGLVGMARKTKPVDARPAKPGEIIVTVIAGEGQETRSRPAHPGDWVVRNRCPETGNEEYLVGAVKFEQRYVSSGTSPDAEGWREFRPVSKTMRFMMLRPDHGSFTFQAPWGERMVARPGDAILQDPDDENDIYRVAAASFACTYETLK